MINTEAEPLPNSDLYQRNEQERQDRNQDAEQHLDNESPESKSSQEREFKPHPEQFGLLQQPLELKDIGILAFGVAVPGLMIASFAIACSDRIIRLIIKHPIETLLECLLILSVPIINLCIWKAIRLDESRYARRNGVLLGLSIGSSAVVALVTATALALGYPVHDIATGMDLSAGFMLITICAWLTLSQGLYMAARLRRMREMRSSRARQILYSAVGAVLALVGFAGAEARSTVVRWAEQMAISHDKVERQNGLKLLGDLHAERDLIMEGADDRTAGFPGLFIQIHPERVKPLYFTVTGERYRSENEANYQAMSSDYLLRHFIGEPVKGLSLLRSTMTGAAHPDTCSSTLNWTFVFSNDTNGNQESCAQIALPPGAVITGVTAWPDGKRQEGGFYMTHANQSQSLNYGAVGKNDPIVVTDVGRGRILLHCYPVPAHAEMKVQLTVVTPMVVQSTGNSTLTLPRFVSSNFAIKGDHQLMLRSEKGVQLEVRDGESRTLATGENTLLRALSDEELAGAALVVGTKGSVKLGPIAARDPFSSNESFIYQQISQARTDSPKDVVVVIDGSKSMAKHIEEVKSAMKKLPGSINASLIVATEDSARLKAVGLHEGLQKLKAEDFTGGQDNLEAVVKAAEKAGSDMHGAVLWIHGQQPCYSKEIYLMAPFVSKPKIYEVSLDNGETDVQEFLKNHDDIGPVATVPRVSTLRGDLENFLDHWKAGEVDSVVALSSTTQIPKDCRTVDGDRARELAVIWAHKAVSDLLDNNQRDEAAKLALAHHIVSAETVSAVAQAAKAPSQDGFAGDAAVMQGINTAGSVRINNLASLEALLNIFANGMEILGFIIGGSICVNAFISPKYADNRMGRFGLGLVLVGGGFATPGVVNWFVASARDANLFS